MNKHLLVESIIVFVYHFYRFVVFNIYCLCINLQLKKKNHDFVLSIQINKIITLRKSLIQSSIVYFFLIFYILLLC